MATLQESKFRRVWLAGMVLTGLLAWPFMGEAQQTVIGKVKKFSVSHDFHPPPHQSQMKSLLQGAEAVPTDGGRVVTIKDGKLQTFHEDGKQEMLVEAPHCVYDATKRSVTSDGSLRAQTADGRFSISGEGFAWHTTNSVLLISNRVRTYIHPDLLQSGGDAGSSTPSAAAPSEGIEILSDEFEFATEAGIGVYRRNVRVAGTNLAMSAGILTIRMPISGNAAGANSDATEIRMPAGQRQLETITAERSVVVDYLGAHATGERAIYSARTGIIDVTGQPTWQADQREGRADHITIDRTNRVFLAQGNSWLKLPGQTMGPASLLPAGKSSKLQPATTNSFVEIRSDSYELRTNWGVFRKAVRVVERRGSQASATMDCGLMTLAFTGTNQLDRLVAEDNVVISQEDKRLTGGKAVYTGKDGVLELTREPQWLYGPRQGRGRVLRVHSRQEEMVVQGNASMRLPAREFGQLTAVQDKSKLAAPTNSADFADVFAEEYSFTPLLARFRGGVYISHPSMNWACESLTIQLPPESGPIQSILAEQGVSFDLLDKNGEKVHGTGDRVVYTYNVSGNVTNELVELSGNPVLERTDVASGNPITMRNRVFVFDRIKNAVIVTGNYYGFSNLQVSNTNVFGSNPLLPPK
ncbi:MAG TPA: hypothetical protein VN673_19345 [Clostridia bacterium]|nr:hypothetical protein [Clostridia bacterium]